MQQTNDLLFFLTGTFLISLVAFAFMVIVPGGESPEVFPGLLIWIVAVWSPSIVAIIIAVHRGKFHSLFHRLIAFQQVGWAWIVVLLAGGTLLVALLLNWQDVNWDELTPSLLFLLVGFNLFLGPLGEELGWRGYLLPVLQQRVGWVGATLFVAVVWAVWHAPLWLINSPQQEIPFLIFCVHVLAYSIIMTAAYSISPDSLIPAVLLHLVFNVSSGLVPILGIANTREWYIWSTSGYMITAAVAVLFAYWLVSFRTVSPQIY